MIPQTARLEKIRKKREQPAFFPILRRHPSRVKGTPNFLDSLALALVIPSARFQEKDIPGILNCFFAIIDSPYWPKHKLNSCKGIPSVRIEPKEIHKPTLEQNDRSCGKFFCCS